MRELDRCPVVGLQASLQARLMMKSREGVSTQQGQTTGGHEACCGAATPYQRTRLTVRHCHGCWVGIKGLASLQARAVAGPPADPVDPLEFSQLVRCSRWL